MFKVMTRRVRGISHVQGDVRGVSHVQGDGGGGGGASSMFKPMGGGEGRKPC